MDLDYNTSDGESTDEENPYEQQEKTRRLAWALGQKWDTKVADDRDRLRVDELPGDDDRRNTAELLADLRRLRRLSKTRVANRFRFAEGLGLLEGAPVDFGYDDLDQLCVDELLSHAHAHGMAALSSWGNHRAQRMDYDGFLKRSRRLFWDIGGGGKSRRGYHGEEQWVSICKVTGKWRYLGDMILSHGQTYIGDLVAMGAASIGPGRALAHRVNPVDGDQWVLVVDWVRA